ncbi:MAG: hypothetical protein ACRDQ0_13565, partial [Pseudonocardia sp.]
QHRWGRVVSEGIGSYTAVVCPDCGAIWRRLREGLTWAGFTGEQPMLVDRPPGPPRSVRECLAELHAQVATQRDGRDQPQEQPASAVRTQAAELDSALGRARDRDVDPEFPYDPARDRQAVADAEQMPLHPYRESEQLPGIVLDTPPAEPWVPPARRSSRGVTRWVVMTTHAEDRVQACLEIPASPNDTLLGWTLRAALQEAAAASEQLLVRILERPAGPVSGTVRQHDHRGVGPFHGEPYELCGKPFVDDGDLLDCTDEYEHDGRCSQ